LDKDELTCLQIPTVFQVDGRITFVSYWMYMGLTMLGRLKYIELSH
jgi:hypothetical protein